MSSVLRMKPRSLWTFRDETAISLDFQGKAPGRGAYLCPNPDCLKKAIKSRALERAFSAAIPQEIYVRLEEEMSAQDG